MQMNPCALSSIQFVSLVKLHGFAFFIYVIYFLVVIHVNIDGEYVACDGNPIHSIADVLYQNKVKFNAVRHVMFLNGKPVDPDAMAHTLYEETTCSHMLEIVSKISEFLIGG